MNILFLPDNFWILLPVQNTQWEIEQTHGAEHPGGLNPFSANRRMHSAVNVCERLFSRAKFSFTDYRKSLEPVHLETQMFLFANRRFWGPTLINKFV